MGELIEEIISFGRCPPLVFKNKIDDWPSRKWTVEYLRQELPNSTLKCKLAPRYGKVCWETECSHEEITLGQFLEWKDGIAEEDNPLSQYKQSEWSCYIDYKYMKDVFSNKQLLLKAVDWSVFGLEDRDGRDSTIWIGSTGCYTNCHCDTYGFNLVAQIYGRKRWILFPPSDNSYLYPTRIPYEESSVFSRVDVKRPDLHNFPLFQSCHPYVIDLEPGDVLFVPRHWWHHVECLDTAISINTWVQMEEDKSSQVTEAVTRLLFGCLMSVDSDAVGNWVNPGEEIQDHETNVEYLQQAVIQCGLQKDSINKLEKFASHIRKDVNIILSQNESTENVFKDANFQHTPFKRIKTDNNRKLSSNSDVVLEDSSTLESVKKVNTTSLYNSDKLKSEADIDEALKVLKSSNVQQMISIVEQVTLESYLKYFCHSMTEYSDSILSSTLQSIQGEERIVSNAEQKGKVDNRSVCRNFDFQTFARSLLHPAVVDKIVDVMVCDNKT